jgi:hypothetical protein
VMIPDVFRKPLELPKSMGKKWFVLLCENQLIFNMFCYSTTCIRAVAESSIGKKKWFVFLREHQLIFNIKSEAITELL